VALVTELDLPAFDSTDPSLTGARFHAVLRDLRERTWIAASPLGFTVLDREASAFFLRTRSATFPGRKIAELFGIEDGALGEEVERNILHLNGEDHRRLRNLVNPAFTPRAADRHRPAMRGFLAELMPSSPCDFVAAVSKPYPALVIAHVMGAPLEDAARLNEWSRWIQAQFDPPTLMTQRDRIERACAEFYDYCDALLAERRDRPADDLVSTLLAAGLTEIELRNLVLNVLVGGVDTTQSQLAHAVRLFAEHPGQWALLAEQPDLVPQAVEEVLRHEPVTPFTARITLEDVTYRDVLFPKGTIVMVASAAANREGTGDAFDITADRAPHKPLTFGAGIHYCLGANLARAELEEALAFLAPRMPGLRLDGEVEHGSVNGIYGLESLPIAF
jgi:cytochrome P450